VTIVLLAKEPISGRVKTRLHPPLSLEHAAHIAAAAIDDTLEVLSGVPAASRVLAYDGVNVPAAARGYRVLPQTDGPLDERLAAVFDAFAGKPVLLVGMDTPQLTAGMIAPALGPWPDGVDAWFGPATDGGWWALALREARGDLLRGVPTSRADTGELQLARLREAGLGVAMLPRLTDVDEIADAVAVARLAPGGRFARAVEHAVAEAGASR
jgi:glycosyltransferase A (GT-A) superfamily protein (DUF2064 family)